ncbi:MAG: indolepyruvate oxidoreductase subunit beta [Desulfurococcaceae archaeon]
MWRKVVNILIASVGGQGGLTLARVLAEAAVMSSWSVRTGETLGMAQRYGSVVSYVRLGLGVEVRSPTFTPGEAGYLLGLELFESLRNIHYLSENGIAIIADEYKPPLQASITPTIRTRLEILDKLKSSIPSAVIIPARKIAVEAGNPRALNMVILGGFNALSRLFTDETITYAIKKTLPEKVAATSLEAYRKGYEYVHRMLFR